MAAASTKRSQARAAGTPLIESCHPSGPQHLVQHGTATFTWQPPAGDPVTNPATTGRSTSEPDTVPDPGRPGPSQTNTYYNLADGTWYLHVRAMGPDGQWGDAAHRQIRIDRLAPGSRSALDPLDPSATRAGTPSP